MPMMDRAKRDQLPQCQVAGRHNHAYATISSLIATCTVNPCSISSQSHKTRIVWYSFLPSPIPKNVVYDVRIGGILK